jgi:hypothetical protein
MPMPSRHRLIFGVYLLVVIAIAQLIFGHFGLPGWPAFMAMIFFFIGEMDLKKVPHILVGGIFGIACLIPAVPIITALVPHIGLEFATLVFVLGIVYAIVALGETVPLLFNNYAFMYLTVGAVAAQAPQPNPYLWMAVTAAGGGLLIAGVLVIGKLLPAAAAHSS